VSRKPLLDTFGVTIREEIKQSVRFQIDNDGSVAFSSFPRKIINANRFDFAHWWGWHEM